MSDSPDITGTTIAPDARAYLTVLLAFSPLLVLYVIVWLKRGSISIWVMMAIIGLTVAGLVQLRSKTVTLDLSALAATNQSSGSRPAPSSLSVSLGS